MKKTLLILLMPFVMAMTFCQGMAVFDLTGWLNGIDQLYSSYDMITNMLAQLEAQYQQIQMSLERAKSIDWDNIKFDGDFDIRDDLKNVTSRVNKLLSSVRNVQKAVTTPSITCGSVRYSIADLCTVNGLENAIGSTYDFMSTTMKNAVSSVVDGLDDKQKKAIWAKYGISPENYAFVQQSVKYVTEKAQAILGKSTEEFQKENLELTEDTLVRYRNLLEASKDSNGNYSEAALAEFSTLLSEETLNELKKLGIQIADVASMFASKMIADLNQEEVEKQTEKENFDIQNRKDARTSSRFKIHTTTW